MYYFVIQILPKERSNFFQRSKDTNLWYLKIWFGLYSQQNLTLIKQNCFTKNIQCNCGEGENVKQIFQPARINAENIIQFSPFLQMQCCWLCSRSETLFYSHVLKIEQKISAVLVRFWLKLASIWRVIILLLHYKSCTLIISIVNWLNYNLFFNQDCLSKQRTNLNNF